MRFARQMTAEATRGAERYARALLFGPRDARFEERPDPQIIDPTDAIARLSATCVCGSDLWPYRGADSAFRLYGRHGQRTIAFACQLTQRVDDGR